eukprot:TRINITY_DN22474_c0_g1_i1.p1 TRINITY_DN22474_c0_g1~~TRINITY_DN22474_c0_g1_i1.p1  ORF type:complete len:377 (+),score=52.85 TRINITY_DN22474_c0_g1_i1:73-1203(+)
MLSFSCRLSVGSVFLLLVYQEVQSEVPVSSSGHERINFDPARNDIQTFLTTIASLKGLECKVRACNSNACKYFRQCDVYPAVTSLHNLSNGKYYISSLRLPSRIQRQRVITWKKQNGAICIVGVFSRCGDEHARSSYREAMRVYGTSLVSFVFVIGDCPSRLEREDLRREELKHRDIVVLDVLEGCTDAKLFAWFDLAVGKFPGARYFAKTDLDSFVHSVNLVGQLALLPSGGLLYGFDCAGRGGQATPALRELRGKTRRAEQLLSSAHICGMLMVFSRDLLLCALPVARANGASTSREAEDQAWSRWPLLGGCRVNYAADMYRFYDYGMDSTKHWQRPRWNNHTVCVHQLKTEGAWATLRRAMRIWPKSALPPQA